MKFIVLAMLLAAIPMVASWARGRARRLEGLVMALGFLPFFGMAINVVSDPTYRGDSQGLEISLTDLCAAVLVLALPARRVRIAGRWARLLYFGLALASLSWAPQPDFALYGVWKVGRLFFLGMTAARLAVDPGLVKALVRGLCAGLLYAAVLALWQRYALGRMQCPGSFVHQNGLGMTAELVAPLALSLVLSGNSDRLIFGGLLAAPIAIVLSLSRGAMILGPLALALVLLASLRRKVTPRKLGLLALGLAGSIAVLAAAGDTIIERFATAPKASMEGRERFKIAAHMMQDEHRLGVGINQFSWVLGHDGYGQRAELPAVDLNGIVHNIYRLNGAELGGTGLGFFMLVLFIPVAAAMRSLWAGRHAGGVAGELLAAGTVALCVVYAHSTLEWALRITQIAQVQWLVVGMVAGLTLRHRTRPAARRVPQVGTLAQVPVGPSPCKE